MLPHFRRTLAMVGSFVLFTAGSAWGTDWYVTSTLDSGPGTLRELVANALPGDVIHFSTPTSGDTIFLTSSIEINKGITVAGINADETILHGGDSVRIFNVSENVDVKIVKLRLIHGFARNGGGGIYNAGGSLNLEYVIIDSCRTYVDSVGFGGGAITNRGSITIDNCRIKRNISEGPQGTGGGLFNGKGGSMTIYDSFITGNQATTSGGGLSNLSDGTNYLHLRDVQVNDNTAGTIGGGISIQGNGVVQSMYEGTVSGNTASQRGGGIHLSQGPFTVRSVRIEANQAMGNNQHDGGGGIYVDDGYMTVNPGVRIINNLATGTLGIGGGIVNINNGKLRVNDAQVKANTAIVAGGGIAHFAGSSGNLSVIHSIIDSNSVTGFDANGGGIFCSGTDTISLVRSELIGNSATGSGGAVYTNAIRISLTETLFHGNQSARSGGGIFNAGGYIYVRQARFYDNQAKENGGAIASPGGYAKIRWGHFLDNRCSGLGGAVYLDGTGISTDDVRLNGNLAHGNLGQGGAMYTTGGSEGQIKLGSISHNSASGKGGGVKMSDGDSLVFYQVNMLDNLVTDVAESSASISGGGICNTGGNLTITASTLAHNSVPGGHESRGGGLAVVSPKQTIIKVSTISGNTSGGLGGGIHTESEMYLGQVTMVGNQARKGGGLSVASTTNNTVTLKGTANSDNYASSITPDIYLVAGVLHTQGFNLIGADPGDVFIQLTTDLEGSSGNFLRLADNGDPTLTHRPAPGSIVIDNGDTSYNSQTTEDQIGQRVSGDRRDIGAFEVQQ